MEDLPPLDDKPVMFKEEYHIPGLGWAIISTGDVPGYNNINPLTDAPRNLYKVSINGEYVGKFKTADHARNIVMGKLILEEALIYSKSNLLTDSLNRASRNSVKVFLYGTD